MTEITALWLPVLLSAVAVFVLSSIIHMATPWHKGDYRKLGSEDKFMDAARSLNIAPGDYMVPRPDSMKEMNSPEFKEKFKRGPVMTLTVMPSDHNWMGKQLALWFLYCVLVGVGAAFIASPVLPPGTPYKMV